LAEEEVEEDEKEEFLLYALCPLDWGERSARGHGFETR
jgi:hypothetical protein